MIGADARVPAMVLMRAPLGQRGSWAPTVLNAAQCVGWAIFELLIIATAVAALSDELLRLPGAVALDARVRRRRARARAARPDRLRAQVRAQVRGLGGARVAALPDLVGARRRRLRRALGPRGRGRLRRCSTASTSSSRSPSRGSRSPPTTRASRATAASAFWGTAVGYLLAEHLAVALGAILFFSRDVTDPAALPVAVAAGGLGAVLALLAVTVDETDEAFANAYSAAVSIQNLAPRAAAAGAPRRRRGRRDGRRADDRPALLPELPAHARLVLRAALRRPARRLARGGLALPRAGRLRRARRPLGDARRLDRRLRALPVAAPRRPVAGGSTRSARAPTSAIGATLPSFAVSFALGLAVATLGRRRVLEFGAVRGIAVDREPRAGHDRRRPPARRRRALPRRAGAAAPRRRLADRGALGRGRPPRARRAAGRARRSRGRWLPAPSTTTLRDPLPRRGARDVDRRPGLAVDARGRAGGRPGRVGAGRRPDARATSRPTCSRRSPATAGSRSTARRSSGPRWPGRSCSTPTSTRRCSAT